MYWITKKSGNSYLDEDPNNIMADTLITGTTLIEKESRSIGDVPVGGIIAWAKSFSGVPNLGESYRECDGSVIVDALSPMNGQTLPDLTDNRFLKGSTTSGATGGSTTTSNDGASGIVEDGVTSAQKSDGDHVHTITPVFYAVVWVMRIR